MFLGSVVAVLVAVVLLGLIVAGLSGPVRRLAAARSDLGGLAPRARELAAAVARTRRHARPPA